MKILDYLDLLASIADDAKRILHKRIGKTKGLDALETQIRDEATKSAKKAFGGDVDRVAKVHIDRYVAKRMTYMRNAFKQLNNPKTDTSAQRAKLIGDTETRSAKSFGRTKGFERRQFSNKKTIFKEWIDNDGCDVCSDNAEDGPIPVDQPFSSGHYSPQAHPNCTCGVEYTNEDGDVLDEIDEADFDEGDED